MAHIQNSDSFLGEGYAYRNTKLFKVHDLSVWDKNQTHRAKINVIVL